VTPLRGACGTTETAVIYAEEQGPSITNDFLIQITVPLSGGTLDTPPVPFTIPTTGGVVGFTGSNLGPAGPLAFNEDFFIVGPGGNNIFCDASITSATTLSCIFGEGVGYGNISATICNTDLSTGKAFSYQAPTVTSVVGQNATRITINGTNFGPDRVFDNIYDSVLVNDGAVDIPCTVLVVTNHTQISCQTAQLLAPTFAYTLSLTIGDQHISFPFTFAIPNTCNCGTYTCQSNGGNFTCSNGGNCRISGTTCTCTKAGSPPVCGCTPACLNGGTCTSGTCDCSATGFEGVDCGTPSVCSPTCQNGGTCTLQKTCSCPADYEGDACQNKSRTSGKDSLYQVSMWSLSSLLLLLAILQDK